MPPMKLIDDSMPDNHTPEQRRKNMQAIRSKDTSIELMLRKELWNRGLHYRKNVRTLPGKPDIVFQGKKVAIFCDSEFWHGYNWETRKTQITTNREYWIPKIERNIERDKEVNSALQEQGWKVLRFWGKDIQNNLSECADIIEEAIQSDHES